MAGIASIGASVASALFAATLFILSIVGREWQDVGQLVFNGGIVGTIVLIGTIAMIRLSLRRLA